MVERASLVVRRAPRGVLVRGDRVRWRGSRWAVAGMDEVTVHLVPDGGGLAPLLVLLAVLAYGSDFAVLDGTGQPLVQAELPDFAALEGVCAHAAQAAQQWWRAVIEVDTGLPPDAAPGARPRPMSDPDTTTLIERYQAKAAELHAVLGWSVSWQTVQAKRLAYRKSRKVASLVDRHSTKERRLYGLPRGAHRCRPGRPVAATGSGRQANLAGACRDRAGLPVDSWLRERPRTWTGVGVSFDELTTCFRCL
ncbi:hypothetical protein ABZ527_36455 [Streptomyces griseofuscus]|uniref:hypothetical protein n=1 Tax=Streptomyces griseofuscus TaxID=146922 RepID=UPI003407EFE7